LSSQKANSIVKKLYELGTLSTTDGVDLPVFEIELQQNIKIEYNKVGVNQLIKEYILRDAGKGALASYFYADENKPEWRFSFISKYGGSEFFAEVEDIETNPKKYTYIFGTQDEHRTALERLYNLEQSRFRIDDFFEAFNVEPVSNNFFKEYKNFYLDFVQHISNNEDCRKVFESENSKDIEKDIRNFVKRLLGRIVFLYFLQKKSWLGASDTSYTDGDTNFLYHLFKADKANFYKNWLSKLFFNALNREDRPNDEFELPDQSKVCIPFLNGGLFEEHQEPEKHRELNFPEFLFESLLSFFNGYNFTVYENSPDDHVVAVDPEMLSNIFENLLEDNKDKGAVYTPKDIVQYMTQESIIEYLNTHLDISKTLIENLVKKQVLDSISKENLKKIDALLDKVKICDPAIGSGAFPMGMLQEIFAIKALIHHELELGKWKPAEVKQNIIQNSIYGVDIEEGAVDIARLRFWLSLVVDEDKPKPLPNLDYKIMQGNSLLESFEGIPLEKIMEADKPTITKQTTLDLDDTTSHKITLVDYVSPENFKELLDKYFSPEDWEKRTGEKVNKQKTKQEINKAIEGKIHYTLLEEKNRLNITVKKFEKKYNIKNKSDLNKLNSKGKEFKNYQVEINRLNRLDEIEQNLVEVQKTNIRPYFLWHLFFKDVFDQGGFDIIIGNPPYISAVTMKRNDAEKIEFKKLYPEATGSYDLYILFLLKGRSLLNCKGIYSWIIPNKFLVSNYAVKTKNVLIDESLHYALNVSSFDVFKGIGVYPIILFGSNNLKNGSKFDEFYLEQYSDLLKRKIRKIDSLPEYPTLKEIGLKINSGATGFQAKQLKTIVVDEESKHDNSIPFTVSGNIDRYNWNNKKVKFMKDTYENAFVLQSDIIADSKWKFWKEPKIVIAGMTKVIESVFVENELALGVGVYGIYDFAGYDPYSLTGLLNSKYYSYYFVRKFKDKHLAGGYLAINKSTIHEFPLIDIDFNSNFCLKKLSYLVHFINRSKSLKISEIVDDKHIVQFFEEVIDACVFEIYFKEHMNEREINIIGLLQTQIKNIFGDNEIEDLEEQSKKQKIWEFYKNLKNSEVQQRMRLFVTKSPDVLKPILQS